MTKLEDDVYSFGFILLEALVGATISEREEAILLNEMVSSNLHLFFITWQRFQEIIHKDLRMDSCVFNE